MNPVARTVRKCFYCGKLYKPKTVKQEYCEECSQDRMDEFRKSRTYKVCGNCRSTFLSINGAKYCKRCRDLFGK